ncbi:MAG: PilZ domain-containing protein [Deltaproteobacteria bacterium]|nr:PilZ domain-containing protein [Deltaproteobacteria bacterium]
MRNERERRELKRTPFTATIWEERSDGMRPAKAVDICALGMRYERQATKVAKDREVLLEFCLPDDNRPLKVLGCVAGESVRGSVHSTSVTFAMLAPADAKRLQRFMSRDA